MDWIERIFGIAPDGGDGSTELAIAALSALGLLIVVVGYLVGRRKAKVRGS